MLSHFYNKQKLPNEAVNFDCSRFEDSEINSSQKMTKIGKKEDFQHRKRGFLAKLLLPW